MRGFSKVIITGNLTRDPELRTTPSGSSVCGFAVAVNRVYRDANGAQQEDVSFFDCTAWGKLGEVIAQYGKKGSGVLVSGRLQQRSWEDKAGQKRSSVEIVAEDFNFIGGGNAGDGTALKNSNSKKATEEVVPDDIPEGPINLDEIPF